MCRHRLVKRICGFIHENLRDWSNRFFYTDPRRIHPQGNLLKWNVAKFTFKLKNAVIIYGPSCHSKPKRYFRNVGTVFWGMLLTLRYVGNMQVWNYMNKYRQNYHYVWSTYIWRIVNFALPECESAFLYAILWPISFSYQFREVFLLNINEENILKRKKKSK